MCGIKGKEMTGSSHWDIKLLGILLKCCQNNFPRLQLGIVKGCFLVLTFYLKHISRFEYSAGKRAHDYKQS